MAPRTRRDLRWGVPEWDTSAAGRTNAQPTLASGRDPELDWTSPMASEPGRAATTDLGQGVELESTLARGGEAVVHQGTQRKLGRKVAVKTTTGGHERDRARLLREARLMGRLEHPNILPVHDIFVDDAGEPQVVLKLVEGETWSKLMGQAEQVRERYGAEDLLEWNLEVLDKVCRALSFAHSHGVIHRDVKPSNIMVGAFGEVYLLDWGIALELKGADTDVGGEAPLGATVGTMAYMSPEQLAGEADALGPWTDVYLLGATLFHALTGRPPHADKSRLERLHEVIDGVPEPALGDEIPAELRVLLSRALEEDPRARTRDVESFRRALSDFSSHRAARRLVTRGDDARARADGSWERGEHGSTLRHLLEAEVAYRAAQQEWPECPEAASGVGDVITLRVEHALATGEPALAARLVKSHAVTPPLQERVREAVRAAEAEQARLRRLEADADSRVGHRARGVLGATLVTLFLVFWTWTAFDPPATLWPLVGFTGFAVAAVVGAILRSRVIRSTRLNRMVMTTVLISLVAMLAWFAGASMLGLGVRETQIGLLLLWAVSGGAVATIVHPLGLPSAASFFVAFLVAAHVPTATPWATLGAGLVMLLNQLALNRWITGRHREARADTGPNEAAADSTG